MKYVFAAIAFLVFACNDTGKNSATTAQKSTEDSLYDAVMEGHDVGMAKMSKLKRALSQVQQKLDSLVRLPANSFDKEYQQSLVDLQEDLNYAEYGMNTWMEEFKLDSAKNNPELRIKYLQSEKDKVVKVRDNILNGLARADSLLNK